MFIGKAVIIMTKRKLVTSFEGVLNQKKVDYFALVPFEYDARRPDKTALTTVDKQIYPGGLVVCVSEVVRVVAEMGPGDSCLANHVSTDTGRWIPKKYIKENPSAGDLLLVPLKQGAKPKPKPKK